MNQILDYETGNSNNGGNYDKKPKQPRGGGQLGISDKVVKVFALLLVLIAAFLIFSGVFSILKNKKDSKEGEIAQKEIVQAEILAEMNEETGKVNLSVTNKFPISKLIYNWDEDTERVLAGDDKTEIEEEIDLPSGIHTLHIKVVDRENNQTTNSFQFEAETGTDTTSPNIKVEVTENKKLLITAEDDTALAYITYKWNEDEQTTIPATEEDPTKIEFELEIPIGKNTITVIAVDASERSNTESIVKTLEGVTKPEISYAWPNGDASAIEIIVTHENGIKNIYYTLNGNAYEYNVPEDQTATSLSFIQESVPGTNEFLLKVTSVNDTTAEFNVNWKY